MARRGVWAQTFLHFFDSLKPRKSPGNLVGSDQFGNKYFEVPLTSSNRARPRRYYETAKKEDFEAVMPAEWESWLRHRRKIPPTKEEVEASFKLMEQKKKGAAEIAERFKMPKPNPEIDPLAFPDYGEHYDKNPGRFSNKDDDKK